MCLALIWLFGWGLCGTTWIMVTQNEEQCQERKTRGYTGIQSKHTLS